MPTTPLFAALLLTLFSGVASAASYGDTSPIYAGGGAGRMQFSAPCGGGHCKGQDNTSAKVFAGFNFAPFSAWQGSELTSSVELVGYRSGKMRLGRERGAASVRGAGLSYRISSRETDALSVHARAGLTRLSGTFDGESGGSTGITGGLGMAYALDKHLSLTADYDVLRAGVGALARTRVHLLTFGAAWKF